MALSAKLSLSNSNPEAGQPITVWLTVTNTSTAVNCTAIDRRINSTASCSLGEIYPAPSATTVVAASGNTVFTWQHVWYAPMAPGTNVDLESIAAVVYTDDGAATTASTITVNVEAPGDGAVLGQYDGSSNLNSGLMVD